MLSPQHGFTGLVVIAICYFKSILAGFLVLKNTEHPLTLLEDANEKLAADCVLSYCPSCIHANHWTTSIVYRVFGLFRCARVGLADKA